MDAILRNKKEVSYETFQRFCALGGVFGFGRLLGLGQRGSTGGGGNGESGGAQTIFDKLIGTWEGVNGNPTVYVFTKEGVTYDTVKEVPVEEVTLKDGRIWALYYNDKEANFPYMLYYTEGEHLTWMSSGPNKEDIYNLTKDELDTLVANILAVKKS